MIVDFDNLKIDLKEVEAITDVMHFTSKEGFSWWAYTLEQWQYTVYMRSGREFTTFCFEESELEKFNEYHDNLVGTWWSVNG